MAEADRLRWRCRRGLLELDLILLRFLEREYPVLSPAEQAQFAELIALDDDRLLALIQGRLGAGEWAALVERLTAC